MYKLLIHLSGDSNIESASHCYKSVNQEMILKLLLKMEKLIKVLF